MDGGIRPAGRSNARSRILLVLTFLLLFSSFRWDIFGIERTQPMYSAEEYIIPSLELYAGGPALQRNLGQIQLLGDNGTYEPYFMQAGLQRMFYSWISPHSKAGVDRALPYLQSLIVAFLALTFTAFLAVVQREFGSICAGVAAVLLALSNWLVMFATDVFWISSTFFIPFVLAWLLGDPARPVRQQRLLAGLFTLFCLIKCLCGFDYTTNIFAAVAVPFLYYGLRRGVPLRSIALRVVRYGALSVAALGSAILLQLLQFSYIEKVQGSTGIFFKEAFRRTLTNGEGLNNGYDRAVLSVLHTLHVSGVHDAAIQPYLVPLRPILRYFRYLSMGAFTVPLPVVPFKVPIGLFVVGFAAFFWIQRKRLRREIAGVPSRTTAWMWATLASLFVTHLWIVAANGHMTHTFFNAIIFYIPFLPMAYVVVGLAVTSVLHQNLASLETFVGLNPTGN